MPAEEESKFKNRTFFTCIAAEFMATTLFVFLVCGSTIAWQNIAPIVLHIALSAGFTLTTLVMVIGHLTGGLVNPAVNIPLMITGRLPILEGVCYTVVQLCGGILGAALLYGLTPSDVRGTLGTTAPAPNVSGAQALGVEIILTFVLVLTIYSAIDPGRDHRRYEVPLSIGVSVVVCHVVGIPFTGCSMNPARSFGPALIMNSWKYHWVYWVGPIPGGILAGLLYEYVLCPKKALVQPA